jgi:antitoxin ParD1/3/4
MARTTSVALGDTLGHFVEHQVRSGRYGSTSEVIRAGLRLLEERETRLAHLREALSAGEASGPTDVWDAESFLAGRPRGQ